MVKIYAMNFLNRIASFLMEKFHILQKTLNKKLDFHLTLELYHMKILIYDQASKSLSSGISFKDNYFTNLKIKVIPNYSIRITNSSIQRMKDAAINGWGEKRNNYNIQVENELKNKW